MIEVPRVDKRSATDVAREIYARLGLGGLSEDQLRGRVDAALVNVFARFSEIVIERLNKTPEKKFLAFLDLLGVSPLAPEAARVPLTFFMAPKAAGYALVQKGTRVAASPTTGGGKPVIFETQTELVLTSMQLDALFLRSADDRYADLDAALALGSSMQDKGTVSLSEGAVEPLFKAIPHALCISVLSNPAWQTIDRLQFQFVLDDSQASSIGARAIQWEIHSGSADIYTGSDRPIAVVYPETDTTANLTKSGTTSFKSLSVVPASMVDGKASFSICCRPMDSPVAEAEAGADKVEYTSGPLVKEVIVRAEQGKTGLAVEQAFYEKLALDVSKDFFPFGQRPRLGDTLYLGNRAAYSEPGAVI